jgi:hypothetical protein
MTGPCEPVFTVESSLTQDRLSLTLTTAWDDTVVTVQIIEAVEMASEMARAFAVISWLG